MDDEASSPNYMSYLLRIWRESDTEEFIADEDRSVWRASVVSTLTGRRQGFATLDDLFDFFQRQGVIAPDGSLDYQGEEEHNDLDFEET